MDYCTDVKNDTDLYATIIKNFEGIVRWYKETYDKYSKKIGDQFTQAMEADFSRDDPDEMILGSYTDLFAANLSLFSMIDFLQKHLLCCFSKTPGSCRYINSNLHKNWFQCTWNAIQITEALRECFACEGVGGNIDLRALVEERNIRSGLTHGGKRDVCCSAIRCYNIVREMILFIRPELSSELPVYQYPDSAFFKDQEFFSHMGVDIFKNRNTILFIDSVHDIPEDHREIIARLPWNIIVDLDGSSRNGGLRPLLPPAVDKQILSIKNDLQMPLIDNMRIDKGYTLYLQCGEYCIHTPNSLVTDLYTRDVFFTPQRNRIGAHAGNRPVNTALLWESFSEALLKQLANDDKPVNIVFLSGDEDAAREIIKRCDKYLGDDFRFALIYYVVEDTVNAAVRASGIYPLDAEKCIFSSLCSLPDFFAVMKKHEKSLPIVETATEQVKKLPCENGGLAIVPPDLAYNLETNFDVLYVDYQSSADFDKDEAEKLDYYKGHGISWSVFRLGADVDLLDERNFNKHINNIKTQLGKIPDSPKKKIFRIQHAPGIGGSTLLRKIGWRLHREYPVLLVKKYDRELSLLLRKTYDSLKKSIVVLADDDISNIHDLKKDIENLDRACVLIFTERSGSSDINQKYNNITLSTIDDFAKERLHALYYRCSPLDKSILEKKDADRKNGMIMDKTFDYPFMIALYYMEKEFLGIKSYVEKTLASLDYHYLNAVMMIALCSYYSGNAIRTAIINSYLGKSAREDITESDHLSSIIFMYEDTSINYKSKHYLISEEILRYFSAKRYGDQNFKNHLYELSEILIDAVLANGLRPYSCELLRSMYIDNSFDDSYDELNGFAKLIRDTTNHRERNNILKKLANDSASLCDCETGSSDYPDLCDTVAHFYGHLGRLMTKGNDKNFQEAKEFSMRSREYHERSGGHDNRLHHMCAEICRLDLKNDEELLRAHAIPLDESQIERLEDILEAAVESYDLCAECGSSGPGFVSMLQLLMDHTEFLNHGAMYDDRMSPNEIKEFKAKHIEEILELIDLISSLELEDGSRDNKQFQKLLDRYDSGSIVGDTQNMIRFYSEKLDKLSNISGAGSALSDTKYGFVCSYLRSTNGDYRMISESMRKKLIKYIEELLSDNYDTTNHREARKKCSLHNNWMRLAKLDGRTVEDGIRKVDAWREFSESASIKNDYKPYYYTYVLHMLSALSGYSIDKAYIGKSLERLSQLAGHYSNYRIRDYLVKGVGMNQLLDEQYVRPNELTAEELQKFVRIDGVFKGDQSKRGHIEIRAPFQWAGEIARFRFSDSGNAITSAQIGHKLTFIGGFSTECLIAEDKYVFTAENFEKSLDLEIARNLANKAAAEATPKQADPAHAKPVKGSPSDPKQIEFTIQNRTEDYNGNIIIEGTYSYRDKHYDGIVTSDDIGKFDENEISRIGSVRDLMIMLADDYNGKTIHGKVGEFVHRQRAYRICISDCYESVTALMKALSDT